MRFHWPIVVALCLAASSSGQPPQPQPGGDIVFRSDVSQVRVDAQVLGRDNRPVTSLAVTDFVLYEEGRQRPIRGFATEEMPLDVLFLFDVSASMQPHVRRIVEAARDALNVLGEGDRVAIMVFDRAARLRTPFRPRDQVHGDFQNVIRQESFNGGTDITRGLLDAARYVQRNARKDARRAIIIVTDDQTERDRDEPRVLAALSAADAVLSALIAPDAMGYRSGIPGGGSPRRGRYPGVVVPDIIFGRRNPPGGGYPGGGYPGGNSRTQPAGSPTIARDSGGDSLAVDDASALEATLQGLRQRYSLYFSMPPGATPGAERSVRVELAASTRRRYPEAEIRCRPTYRIPSDFTPSQEPETKVLSQAPATEAKPASAPAPRLARRPAGETYNTRGPTLIPGSPASGSPSTTPPPAAAPSSPGWRRIDGTTPAPAAPATPESKPTPEKK
ncbi:MAG: VWA domain-containing protein [Candidatus Solibacter usitatus]|nr:VWA domain-containing protein [Candidatus Solibacter usitatus]